MKTNPTVVRGDGSLEWHDSDGKLHRDDDLPALIRPQIYMYGKPHVAEQYYWYQHGKLHRDGDKPAVISIWEGSQRVSSEGWYQNGELHRDFYDQPAFIAYDKDGSIKTRNWVIHGRGHRVNGPSCIRSDGYEEWMIDGLLSRVGGPAVTYWDGRREYHCNGVKVCSFESLKMKMYQEFIERLEQMELPN